MITKFRFFIGSSLFLNMAGQEFPNFARPIRISFVALTGIGKRAAGRGGLIYCSFVVLIDMEDGLFIAGCVGH